MLSVAPGTTIKEATRIMVAAGVSALPVLKANGRLVGIVSQADLIPPQTRPDPRAPFGPTDGPLPRFVRDVMTRRVVTVPVDAEVSWAARKMLEPL